MDQKRPIPTERLRTIRGQIVERFSLEELRDLVLDLGMDWDQLSGNNKSAKTTELLELLNHRTQLPQLLAQLERLRPGVTWALDDLDESAEPPYMGLAFYDEADTELFFGRERLIANLLQDLRDHNLLIVVGASGSGKSSVVRAGVAPALKGLRPPPDGAATPIGSAKWAYLEMTPTDRPLEQLALTLTCDLQTTRQTQAIIRDVAKDPATLHLYLGKYLKRKKKPRAFLLVDQFEELFTLCKDEPARAAFIDGLLAAAESGATTVVITLRADFYRQCLRYPNLSAALQERQQHVLEMSEAELREAIERPAARTGYELEPGLVDKIVHDAGDETGALPLLSHALLETWRRREGRRLTHFGYNEAGGVGGAIARTAERAYNDLDPAQQAVARRIFLQLTELGEGAEDTRRRVALADLLTGNDEARSEAEAVLVALSRARLVTADESAAQVTHEALIREWPALREWLRDNREALRLERRLAAAAAEWGEGGRDPSYLYDGAQLAAAREWAAAHEANLTGTMRDFLDAATAEEEQEAAERERQEREKLAQAEERARAQTRAARKFRRAVVIIAVLAAVAGLAAVLAFVQGRAAVASEAIALTSEAKAVTSEAEALAAKTTAEFNAQEAEAAREEAVVALNASGARLLLNLSQSVFESDPLLADRLSLEAITAGSETAGGEATSALSANLLSGLTTAPITATAVVAFTGVHTSTAYVVDYQLQNDLLLSGDTGAPVAPLTGNVGSVTPIPDSPFFVVNYSDAPTELRRTDSGEVVPLDGEVYEVFPIPDSPFFVVDYSDAPTELRRTDDEEQIVTLNGNLSELIPIPDSPFFVVNYDDPFWDNSSPSELRRTDDGGRVMTLSGDVSSTVPIPDSPFFVVDYSDAPDELRRTDDGGRVITLSGDVSSVVPILDSPFFVVRYYDYDAPAELRRTDDGGRVITLSGDVSSIVPIPDSPFFVVDYRDYDAPAELRRTDDEEQIVTLNNHVYPVIPIPDSPFFVVNYSDAPAELRRTDDVAQIVALNGYVYDVTPIPESPFFVVDYNDAPGELRRTDDVEQVITLSGNNYTVTPILDSPFFLVYYHDAPTELRRTDDVKQIILLNGDVDQYTDSVIPIPESPFFVVNYTNAPTELRWLDSGAVVMDEDDRRMAAGADVLWTGEDGYYFIRYQDGTGAIVTAGRTLVDLEQGAEQAIYFSETNHVAVRYGDGRVVYIDLNLIEAIAGPDAEETLAAMSPEELVGFTCDLLFTDNPEWDETKLDEYRAFLPGGEPQACNE